RLQPSWKRKKRARILESPAGYIFKRRAHFVPSLPVFGRPGHQAGGGLIPGSAILPEDLFVELHDQWVLPVALSVGAIGSKYVAQNDAAFLQDSRQAAGSAPMHAQYGDYLWVCHVAS